MNIINSYKFKMNGNLLKHYSNLSDSDTSDESEFEDNPPRVATPLNIQPLQLSESEESEEDTSITPKNATKRNYNQVNERKASAKRARMNLSVEEKSNVFKCLEVGQEDESSTYLQEYANHVFTCLEMAQKSKKLNLCKEGEDEKTTYQKTFFEFVRQ